MNAMTPAAAGWLLLFCAGLAVPWIAGNDYQLTVLATAYIFALATLGLNLITGYAGQYNLAHGGFMGIGAYTVGILTVDHGLSFWPALLLAGLVPTALGIVVGAVALRLKGHYFSIFTLCIGVIISLLLEKWESLTHGPVGIIGIPAPPPIGPLSFDSPRSLYFLTFGFLVLGVWVMSRIVRSLMGRSFMAIRNGEPLAEAIGLPLMRNKLTAFLISVFFAGIAGGLYAGFVRFIGPGIADVGHTFDMTIYMLVGGLGTLVGPLLGAIAVPLLTQSLQFLQEYRFIVFGPLLVALIIFAPQGIAGSWMAWRARQAALQPKRPLTDTVTTAAADAGAHRA